MSDEEGFYTRMTALASMVQNFILNEHLISTYERMLKPLGYAKVNQALDQIILERDSRDPFPSVKEIASKVNPVVDPSQEADITVAKIISAVSSIGPYRIQDARAFIGEHGWSVVKLSGGWETVCDKLDYKNEPTLKAQWKQLAISIRHNPSLVPASTTPKALEGKSVGLLGFGDLMNQLTKGATHEKEDNQDHKKDHEEDSQNPEVIKRVAPARNQGQPL